MARRVVQLFINDAAGAWSHRRTEALQAAFVAAGARVIVSPSRFEALRIADTVDHVCVIGGDGTLRHVAAAVARAGRPMTISVYPAGTVNLVARECGYPRDPAVFVRRALQDTPPKRHFAGLIGDTMLVGCASVGPDSYAVDRMSPRLKRALGRFAYVASFLSVLGRWPRPQLHIAHDGQETLCEAVYIAKGRFYAGPWSFAPEASVTDPKFHVVALRRATRLDFLLFLWALWRRHDLSQQANLIRFTCTELSVEGDAALPVQSDGDSVAHLPVSLAISPETLSFA